MSSRQKLEQEADSVSPALGKLPGWEMRSNTQDQEDPGARPGHSSGRQALWRRQPENWSPFTM